MTKLSENQGPLAGLNVIDFGHYYAGPLAGLLLADQGANVIRVVRPGEPELREQQYRLFNRNKKMLTLDLKVQEDRSLARSLIKSADVVIENFRPGVMKRLELDYFSVKADNPTLVYLSLPGFASNDKERAHIQAWEGVLSAAVGLYKEAHQQRELLNFPPVYSWSPLCSMYGGVNGAIAVMAALLARDKYGVGNWIEVPLLEIGSVGLMVQTLFDSKTGLPRIPDSERSVVNCDIVQQTMRNQWGGGVEGHIPEHLKHLEFFPEDSPELQLKKLEEAKQLSWSSPFNRMYPCADGRQIYVSPWEKISFTKAFFKVLGVEGVVRREGFLNEGPWVSGVDNSIGDRAGLTAERKQRLTQLISEALLAATAVEWEVALQAAGIPSAVVRTRDEWLALEPMMESGVFTKMDNGKLTVTGRMVDVAGPENTLMEGFQEFEIITPSIALELFNNRLISGIPECKGMRLNKGDLLKGLKVLDLGNVAAAPIGGMTLALYGADVIQAIPPEFIHPEPLSSSAILYQGKRSILTDVKTEPGKKILDKLVSWADVVTHNILDDTALRMGVSHAQLQAINSDVVSCQVSAFGGTHRGVWEGRKGFDLQLSVASGLMVQYGSLGEPHPHFGVAQGDIMGGFGLAFSALLGVWQQRRTGYAGEARASLARMMCYSQLPFMIAEGGSSDWGEAHGQLAVGDNWHQRIYACKDGWIYVGTNEQRANILANIVTGEYVNEEPVLEAAFLLQDCAYWQSKLNTEGISSHLVVSADYIFENSTITCVSNESANENAHGGIEFLCRHDHPSGVPFVLPANTGVRIGEDHSYFRPVVDRHLGTHTVEILELLGYEKFEIEELIRLNISYEYLPVLGSKGAYFFKPGK